MEIKNLEQALKLQQDLVAKLTQGIEIVRTGKTASIEALLKERERLVERAQAEVEAAIKERDAAVSRWDERIARGKMTVATLQKEVSDLKDRLDTQNKPPRVAISGKAKKEVRGKKPR